LITEAWQKQFLISWLGIFDKVKRKKENGKRKKY